MVFRFIRLLLIWLVVMLVSVNNMFNGMIVVVIRVVWKLFSRVNSIMIISNVFLNRFFFIVVMVFLIREVWLYIGLVCILLGKEWLIFWRCFVIDLVIFWLFLLISMKVVLSIIFLLLWVVVLVCCFLLKWIFVMFVICIMVLLCCVMMILVILFRFVIWFGECISYCLLLCFK